MTSLNPDYKGIDHDVKNAPGIHWRMFMFEGVALIILGVLAVAAPTVATIAVEVFIGWLFLVAGVVGCIAVFSARGVASFLWNLVPAVLSIAVGVLLLWKPIEGAGSLTLLLTALFIVEGVFQILAPIVYRDVIGSSWGWVLVSGLCDLALAAIIILGWPITAAWTLGILVGLNLITSGVAFVMVALAGRDVAGKLREVLQ